MNVRHPNRCYDDGDVACYICSPGKEMDDKLHDLAMQEVREFEKELADPALRWYRSKSE